MSVRLRGWAVASAWALLAAHVQAQAPGGAASAPGARTVPIFAPAFPGAPNQRRFEAVLPAVPHEAQPDARPYPDYFAKAVELTRLPMPQEVPALPPRPATPATPLVVLPVQTQAFGFAPALRALVGALLDAELAGRNVAASRQTELASANGVFTRRLSDPVVERLRREQAPSGLLLLYLGHDGVDTAFVTLSLRDGPADKPRERSAHRQLLLPEQVLPALDAIQALLPGLLSEIGLGAPASARAAGATTSTACPADAWTLQDLDPAAPALARACHALVVGSLLPALSPAFTVHNANTDTPARLAWLAEAWVQARVAGPGAAATAPALQAVAWEQLRLERTLPELTTLLDAPDPVVAPLARLLSARKRAAAMPNRSIRDTAQRFVGDAAQGLPAFVRALFFERGEYGDKFRQVQLCPIEREMPGVMLRAACRADSAAAAAPKPGRASAAQITLYQHWRLASYYKDIEYYHTTQGQRSRLAEHLAKLPDDIAAHPFVQQRRAAAELDQPSLGTLQEHVARVRAVAQAFVQSTAALQRYDTTLAAHSLSEHAWTSDTALLNDAPIQQAIDDEVRLLHVLNFDRFASSEMATLRRRAGMPAAFLGNGPMRQLAAHGAASAMVAAAASAPAAAATPAATAPRQRWLFSMPTHAPMYPLAPETAEQWRAALAARPGDMQARVALAMQMLKEGQSVAQARALIDAQPPESRVEYQVGRSHDWGMPAHAFFLAGELDAARHYYQRVREIGTGSESDLIARTRLPLIDGDLSAAVVAAQARWRRYENDFARLDFAALAFAQGDSGGAWAALQPRLASAQSMWMWVGALSGHRIDRQGAPAIRQWLEKPGLRGARVESLAAGPLLLHLHAVIDRIPGDEDARQFQDRRPGVISEYLNDQWAASVTLTRMAMRKEFDRAAFDAIRRSLALSSSEANKFLQPMFAWAAWHATANQDPELQVVRDATLQSNDFDLLIGKSMVLALDGKAAASLEYLRAARWELSGFGRGRAGLERPLPMHYQYALSTWLMWRETGQEAYKTELRRFAANYQRVLPSEAWPHALQALTESDPKVRAAAICRARTLDAESYFLSLVPAAHQAAATNCRKI